MSKSEFEVSTINSDTNQYFRTLHKETVEAVQEVEEKINAISETIAELEKEKQTNELKLESLKKQKAILGTKVLDVKAIIADLDKNQAGFRSIVAGTK